MKTFLKFICFVTLLASVSIILIQFAEKYRPDRSGAFVAAQRSLQITEQGLLVLSILHMTPTDRPNTWRLIGIAPPAGQASVPSEWPFVVEMHTQCPHYSHARCWIVDQLYFPVIADASSNANSWTSDLSEDAEVQQLLLVQQQLTKIGFDLGSEAGQIGPRTQQALKAYVSLKNPRVTHDLMAQALIDLEMLARLERGVIYQAQGNIWEAMNEYDTAARLDPSNGDAHFHRAEIYHDVGLPELAIAEYEAALYLDQKHFRAYHGRGDAHFDRGHYWLALADHTDGLGSRIMGDAYLVIRGNVIDAKELVAPQVEAAMLWAVGAWNQAREVFAKKIRSFNEEDKQETT